ncbi:hypothetical protein HDU96_009147, partial [Phlyctochytrium bullatum]
MEQAAHAAPAPAISVDVPPKVPAAIIKISPGVATIEDQVAAPVAEAPPALQDFIGSAIGSAIDD